MSLPDCVTAAIRARSWPVYVYDLPDLITRARTMVAALPARCRLFYAMKANSHPAVLAALAPIVAGFEIASGGELAKAAGHPTIFNGPAKTDSEIADALSAGVEFLNAESPHDLDRISHVAGRLGVRPRVLLRLNAPSTVLRGTHQMAGTATQFGMDSLPHTFPPHVDVAGLHLHAVSNNLDTAAHLQYVAQCLALARPMRVVNIGGGFGVDYSGAGAHFDWGSFTRGLHVLLAAHPDMELILEPGRLLTAASGYYAAPVLDVKVTHGVAFAVLRGGSHHFRLPAAMRWSHPFVVLPVETWDYPFARPVLRDTRLTVVGELCTTSDTLARDVPVSQIRPGDIIVFHLAGAYAWEISHHHFLSHPPPKIVAIRPQRDQNRDPADNTPDNSEEHQSL